jgi:hypothetical protein
MLQPGLATKEQQLQMPAVTSLVISQLGQVSCVGAGRSMGEQAWEFLCKLKHGTTGCILMNN